MEIREPKVEFVELEQMETDTTDGSHGQETHMCSGTSYQPDQDECSADPSMF